MEQRKMTPAEAIQILDELAAQTKLDRNGHQLIYTAVATLQILAAEHSKYVAYYGGVPTSPPAVAKQRVLEDSISDSSELGGK